MKIVNIRITSLKLLIKLVCISLSRMAAFKVNLISPAIYLELLSSNPGVCCPYESAARDLQLYPAKCCVFSS